MSNYSFIKFHAHVSSTDGNIRDWLLLNCAFIISDITQCIVLQFLQNFLKNNMFGFSVVLSRKIVQFSIFEVEYLENGLADLVILVSFCRILNGLSDEINLFWRCSSPLRPAFGDSQESPGNFLGRRMGGGGAGADPGQILSGFQKDTRFRSSAVNASPEHFEMSIVSDWRKLDFRLPILKIVLFLIQSQIALATGDLFKTYHSYCTKFSLPETF